MVRPWVAVLTSFHNTPIFGRIWVTVAALAIYAAIVEALALYIKLEVTAVGAQFQGFLGLVLGLLLAFRTNTSYDRWWEGRRLWGQLINDIRNLAIKVQTCVRASPADKQRIGVWLIDFAVALKEHLRGNARLRDLPGFRDANGFEPPHVPAYISARIYQQFEEWRQNDQLGGFELLFLDQHAASLMNVCGACERIQKSPISLSYRWFIRQSIAIYMLALPWGLMQSFGWWTVPTVAMLGYFMIGVEMIAEAVEDPFGVDEDDIMLDDLCRTIEKSVLGILESPSTGPTNEPLLIPGMADASE
jgi:ion channel-forming bestrophin family protein